MGPAHRVSRLTLTLPSPPSIIAFYHILGLVYVHLLYVCISSFFCLSGYVRGIYTLHLTFARTKGLCLPFTLNVLGIAGHIRSICKCPLCDRYPKLLQREAKACNPTREGFSQIDSPVKPPPLSIVHSTLFLYWLFPRRLGCVQIARPPPAERCPPQLSGHTDHYLLREKRDQG